MNITAKILGIEQATPFVSSRAETVIASTIEGNEYIGVVSVQLPVKSDEQVKQKDFC